LQTDPLFWLKKAVETMVGLAVLSINSSALKNLNFLDIAGLDEFFDHTGFITGIPDERYEDKMFILSAMDEFSEGTARIIICCVMHI
jgi:hypothetical protein